MLDSYVGKEGIKANYLLLRLDLLNAFAGMTRQRRITSIGMVEITYTLFVLGFGFSIMVAIFPSPFGAWLFVSDCNIYTSLPFFCISFQVTYIIDRLVYTYLCIYSSPMNSIQYQSFPFLSLPFSLHLPCPFPFPFPLRLPCLALPFPSLPSPFPFLSLRTYRASYL